MGIQEIIYAVIGLLFAGGGIAAFAFSRRAVANAVTRGQAEERMRWLAGLAQVKIRQAALREAQAATRARAEVAKQQAQKSADAEARQLTGKAPTQEEFDKVLDETKRTDGRNI